MTVGNINLQHTHPGDQTIPNRKTKMNRYLCATCLNLLNFGNRRCCECRRFVHHHCAVEQSLWNKPTRVICRRCLDLYNAHMALAVQAVRRIEAKTQQISSILRDNLHGIDVLMEELPLIQGLDTYAALLDDIINSLVIEWLDHTTWICWELSCCIETTVMISHSIDLHIQILTTDWTIQVIEIQINQVDILHLTMTCTDDKSITIFEQDDTLLVLVHFRVKFARLMYLVFPIFNLKSTSLLLKKVLNHKNDQSYIVTSNYIKQLTSK